MSRRIQDTPFADLLPESIRHDSGIAAAAEALDGPLRSLVRAVPNLLLFSRLDPAPGHLSPPLQRLADSAGGLKPLSEGELELLAWQFHVDFRDAADTPAELTEMVRQSIPWHRIKGTPEAVRQAVAIMGLRPVIEEDGRGKDWATFQLGFDEPLHPDQIPRLLTLVNLSKPVRCRLRRIYSGYDLRPLILDRHFGLDRNYLDGESGIYYPDQDLVVSFGYRVRSQALPEERTPVAAWLESCSCLVDYLKRYQLDRFRLDVPLLQPPTLNAAHIECAEIAATDHGHDLSNRVGRWVSKSQLATDWSRLDGVNSRMDRPHLVRVENPWRLDTYRLDASIGRRVIPIHELFHSLVRHAASERTATVPDFQGMECFGGEIFFDLHNPRHRGPQLDRLLLDSPRRERFDLSETHTLGLWSPEPERPFHMAMPRTTARSQLALDACRLDGASRQDGVARQDGAARLDGSHVSWVTNPPRLDFYRLDASIGKHIKPLPGLGVVRDRLGCAGRIDAAPLWLATSFAPATVPAEPRDIAAGATETAFAAPRNLPRFPRVNASRMDASPLDAAYLHGRPFDAQTTQGGAEVAPMLSEAVDLSGHAFVSFMELANLGSQERVSAALWLSGWTNRPWIKHFAYLKESPPLARLPADTRLDCDTMDRAPCQLNPKETL